MSIVSCPGYVPHFWDNFLFSFSSLELFNIERIVHPFECSFRVPPISRSQQIRTPSTSSCFLGTHVRTTPHFLIFLGLFGANMSDPQKNNRTSSFCCFSFSVFLGQTCPTPKKGGGSNGNKKANTLLRFFFVFCFSLRGWRRLNGFVQALERQRKQEALEAEQERRRRGSQSVGRAGPRPQGAVAEWVAFFGVGAKWGLAKRTSWCFFFGGGEGGEGEEDSSTRLLQDVEGFIVKRGRFVFGHVASLIAAGFA